MYVVYLGLWEHRADMQYDPQFDSTARYDTENEYMRWYDSVAVRFLASILSSGDDYQGGIAVHMHGALEQMTQNMSPGSTQCSDYDAPYRHVFQGLYSQLPHEIPHIQTPDHDADHHQWTPQQQELSAGRVTPCASMRTMRRDGVTWVAIDHGLGSYQQMFYGPGTQESSGQGHDLSQYSRSYAGGTSHDDDPSQLQPDEPSQPQPTRRTQRQSQPPSSGTGGHRFAGTGRRM